MIDAYTYAMDVEHRKQSDKTQSALENHREHSFCISPFLHLNL